MNDRYWMANVVWYDGCGAYVSKFILNKSDCDNEHKYTGKSKGWRDLELYLDGNGELLKVDFLYPVSFENIVALKDSDSVDQRNTYERFIEMYF